MIVRLKHLPCFPFPMQQTWGVQNTEKEAHEQLDYAIKERGINCIDTAELYPVPSSAPDWVPGTTEKYIGTWLAKNPGLRQKLYVATKVAGYIPASSIPGARDDPPRDRKAPCRLDRESILTACDASLRRLQTDYIDVYQLHWPDRYVPLFGGREYDVTKVRPDAVDMRETAEAMKALLESGKIRAWGLSNETPWGVCQWLSLAKELGISPPVSIQNHFTMLDRSFEGGLAECCAPGNGNIGLLPWSILAGGALSGKYLNKDLSSPELKNTRFGRFAMFQDRFLSEQAQAAVARYAKVAEEAGMSLATLAQAFCKTRWYIPSSIIGATSMEQLKENVRGLLPSFACGCWPINSRALVF
jgi:aryl-alcohol dehydrogenase-like predicted oxidoreductase